ncbi:hypothetical protein ACH4PU_14740 [Streptomyces sp. NPDC021100]|uniref:hypothetical protein n=1 Tax=Streptomyces sp. NPDC021100 TaxID=3365114 RepID=UPI0037984A95
MSRRQRAADRALARDRRREILAVLLSRAERAVLLPDEARLLRATVETEIADGDRARRSAAGQTAAVRRLHTRVVAAEAAIVEAEQRAETAEQALDDRTYRNGLAEELLNRPELLTVERPAALDRLLDHLADRLDTGTQQ